VFGALLRYADPTWVQALASGALWLLVGVVLSFLDWWMQSGLAQFTTSQLAWSAIGTVWALFISAPIVVGVWQLTRPVPDQPESKQWICRTIGRWSPIAGESANVIAPKM
jgi:hypothetical protein